MMQDFVIIPDIHGEGFWRSAISALPESFLIFLGDYLDPKNDEEITADNAYYNLIDIVNLKKQNPDKVILLWGNHDLHYMYRNLMGSRYDHTNSEKYFQFFWQNQDLFQLAYETIIDGKTYLFTHAGVGRKWAEKISPAFSMLPPSATDLNKLFHTRPFIEALGAKSSARGGWSAYGSMIWADCQEHLIEENQYKNIIQIFGHTQRKEPFVIHNRIYCLDCRCCFIINPSNGILSILEKTIWSVD